MSDQFWLSIGIQLVLSGIVVGMVRQQLKDHTGWLKSHDQDIREHETRLTNHTSRISYIEGTRGLPHGGE